MPISLNQTCSSRAQSKQLGRHVAAGYFIIRFHGGFQHLDFLTMQPCRTDEAAAAGAPLLLVALDS